MISAKKNVVAPVQEGGQQGDAPKKSRVQKKPQKAQPPRKKRRRLTAREKAIVILPAICMMILAGVMWYLDRDINSYTFQQDGAQYYVGNAYVVREGTTLYRNQEDATVLRYGSTDYELFEMPVYFPGENRAVLTEHMLYTDTRSPSNGDVEYFTEVAVDDDGVITVTRDGVEQVLQRGFLYDGGDFYLFLETVILAFNGYRIELPPMSYVQASYTGDVKVYNHASGEFFTEIPIGSVTVYPENKDYTVSLLNDMVTTASGDQWLLFTRPELLDSVFQP